MPDVVKDDLRQGFQEELEALFVEASALTHQLRKVAAMSHREEECPAGAVSLLRILYRGGGQTVPGMARARGLSRQNIQIMVNRLQTRGLVVLSPNPAHKRSALVELTERGRAIVEGAALREQASSEALFPYIPEGRLAPATALLRQIRQLLGGPVLAAATQEPNVGADARAARPYRLRVRKRPVTRTSKGPATPELVQAEEDEFPVTLL